MLMFYYEQNYKCSEVHCAVCFVLLLLLMFDVLLEHDVAVQL